jgi:transposase
VSATARKLAVIIWNMVTKHVPYSPPSQYLFLDQKRKMKIAQVKKLIHKFEIKEKELGLQL